MSNTFPSWLPGLEGVHMLVPWMRVRADLWVYLERWLRRPAHPSPHSWGCCVQGSWVIPSYCSGHGKSGSWVWGFLYLVVYNLPRLYFSSVQSLSPVQLFVTPWTAACQASWSITNSLELAQNLQAVTFSPLVSLYSVAQGDICPHANTVAKGPKSPVCLIPPLWAFAPLIFKG